MRHQVPDPTDFVIEAELTARTVSRFQTLLLAAFQEAEAVRIDLRDPIRMDVCGVQLIESARKFAQRNGKSLVLKVPASADVAHLVDGLGMLHVDSSNNRAFWLHEGVRA